MAGAIGVDRKLASEVRRLALNKIKVILEKPVVEMNERDKDLHDQILLKLAGGILPKLTEITGEDGQEIKVAFDQAFNAEPSRQTAGDSPESPQV